MFLQVKLRAHLCVQAQTQLTRKGRVQAFLVFDNIRQRLHQLQPDIKSSLLQELISALPNVSDKIQQIQALFNVDLLSKNADSLQPREDTDRDYEAAKANRTTAEKALHELLFREKTALQCSKMKFSGTGKDPWLLEMPADFTKRGGGMPPDYELQSETKTCRRYTTPKLQKLLQVLAEAKDDVEIAQRRASARLCALFDSNYAMWCRAVTGLSEFDALLSLAKASESSDGQPMCPAEIIDRAKGSPPILTFSNMRHPFLGGGGGTFVPNDVSIGKANGVLSQPTTCLILTGPNMGGKSTTLRLACFAALLAQLGVILCLRTMMIILYICDSSLCPFLPL
jgi:DNA mismatch repair protein MSH6